MTKYEVMNNSEEKRIVEAIYDFNDEEWFLSMSEEGKEKEAKILADSLGQPLTFNSEHDVEIWLENNMLGFRTIPDNPEITVTGFKNHGDYFSVKVYNEKADLDLWIDVSINDEYQDVEAEWNKYIFVLSDLNDCRVKKYQEDIDNFDECTSIAIDYCVKQNVIMQDADAKWYLVKKENTHDNTD